jgi:hypothetical protein
MCKGRASFKKNRTFLKNKILNLILIVIFEISNENC